MGRILRNAGSTINFVQLATSATPAQTLRPHPPLQPLAQPLVQALVHHLVNACTGVQVTPILRNAGSTINSVQLATSATPAQTLQHLHHLVNACTGVQATTILRSARSSFSF